MAIALEITTDIVCERCHYNLRGLAADGACPECGTAIQETLAALRSELSTNEVYVQQRNQWLEQLACATGYPIDAFLFINDALLFLRLDSAAVQARGDIYATHISAREVCRAVANYTASYFNDRTEARELLNEWKIRTSEDVGRIFLT